MDSNRSVGNVQNTSTFQCALCSQAVHTSMMSSLQHYNHSNICIDCVRGHYKMESDDSSLEGTITDSAEENSSDCSSSYHPEHTDEDNVPVSNQMRSLINCAPQSSDTDSESFNGIETIFSVQSMTLSWIGTLMFFTCNLLCLGVGTVPITDSEEAPTAECSDSDQSDSRDSEEEEHIMQDFADLCIDGGVPAENGNSAALESFITLQRDMLNSLGTQDAVQGYDSDHESSTSSDSENGNTEYESDQESTTSSDSSNYLFGSMEDESDERNSTSSSNDSVDIKFRDINFPGGQKITVTFKMTNIYSESESEDSDTEENDCDIEMITAHIESETESCGTDEMSLTDIDSSDEYLDDLESPLSDQNVQSVAERSKAPPCQTSHSRITSVACVDGANEANSMDNTDVSEEIYSTVVA